MSLLKYVFATGSSLVNEYSVTSAAISHAAIDRISRMKPRIMASRAEISMTPIRIMSRRVTGMDRSRYQDAAVGRIAKRILPAFAGAQGLASRHSDLPPTH